MLSKAYLSLGSNMGDRYGYIMQALEALATAQSITLKKVSHIYETKAWGNTNQADFLNVCCCVLTSLSPRELLEVCQSIEQKLERQRLEKWGPRTIDLDILLYDDKVEKSSVLQLPHPLMTERAFVLKPLVEIAGNEKHPIYQQTIAELLLKVDASDVIEYND